MNSKNFTATCLLHLKWKKKKERRKWTEENAYIYHILYLLTSTIKFLLMHTPFKHPHPFAILAYFLTHILVEVINGWLLMKEIELQIGLILTTKSIQLWHFDKEYRQFTENNSKSIHTFFSMHNVKCKNT